MRQFLLWCINTDFLLQTLADRKALVEAVVDGSSKFFFGKSEAFNRIDDEDRAFIDVKYRKRLGAPSHPVKAEANVCSGLLRK